MINIDIISPDDIVRQYCTIKIPTVTNNENDRQWLIMKIYVIVFHQCEKCLTPLSDIMTDW